MLIITTLLCISCEQTTPPRTQKSTLQFREKNLDFENVHFKLGDELSFAVHQEIRKVIVVDYSKDESGKWYGLCFLRGTEIFGRQIPEGFTGRCANLIDVCYIHENGVSGLSTSKHHKINTNKIDIGSRSTALSIKDLESDFQREMEQRKKKQTSCIKSIISLNPVNECYFEFKDYLLK